MEFKVINKVCKDLFGAGYEVAKRIFGGYQLHMNYEQANIVAVNPSSVVPDVHPLIFIEQHGEQRLMDVHCGECYPIPRPSSNEDIEEAVIVEETPAEESQQDGEWEWDM